MAYKQIIGNEFFYVEGVQANGQPSPIVLKTTTGLVANAPLVPSVGGAATTLTFLSAGVLNTFSAASGTVFTLPAATGSGITFKFIVATTVTSNSHKILVASVADFMQGLIITSDTGTCTGWPANVTTIHSVAMNGTTTAGILGDVFTVTDIAANKWQVNGFTTSTGTAATSFSTATT